jgi:hypothetical protein
MDYHLLTKKCDGMCDSCECPPARDEFVTLGGGLPGDPNGEHAALAVEGLVRKYEGAMLRETLREALSEAYLMGAQNMPHIHSKRMQEDCHLQQAK